MYRETTDVKQKHKIFPSSFLTQGISPAYRTVLGWTFSEQR